jgi:hypothetical protein
MMSTHEDKTTLKRSEMLTLPAHATVTRSQLDYRTANDQNSITATMPASNSTTTHKRTTATGNWHPSAFHRGHAPLVVITPTHASQYEELTLRIYAHTLHTRAHHLLLHCITACLVNSPLVPSCLASAFPWRHILDSVTAEDHSLVTSRQLLPRPVVDYYEQLIRMLKENLQD